MEFLLLDDRENLKLAIIRKLEQQYSFSERKDRLCKQLAISPYLLERNITEINADLQRFGLINEMEISEKNNEILLSQSLRISSSIIEEYYLKDSLEFNLLKTIFFHQSTSIKKYGEKHGMSRTVVYKIVDHIRKELGQYGIKLSKNLQLSGNEMAIRQYFTMLYYRIYKDSEELYNQTDLRAVNQLLAQLKGSYENITNFHLFKHYVLVALERTQRKANYFLSQEENPFAFDEESSIYQEIQSWINEVMKATHAEKNAEIQGIIGNLSVYQSELISEHLLSSHNEAITATKTLFFSYMPFTISDEEFYQEIVPIIYQHRFITPFIDITLRIMDLEFFQERYPIVFNSCRQFLFALDCSAFEFSKLSLFFDLLLVLSRLYDQRNEKSTINLYVNFTQGEKYTQFIKEQIKIFESFSIHFHSAIRPDTDLVVSDYLPKTLFSVKCLIWLAPPRASDWQNFGNEIVRINKELQQTKQRKSE
ncbi:hypothetical protein DVY35_01985 [Enterococcus faecalis]|uniref:helix-turn-helix domain-containing protein n=1 Tax=Enterococcus faecalis TaxID=1351 RepID=UPI0010C11BCB|nr:helix-turn-helix domain-containing protein [Enterococcus faecalis]TKO64415.1 hypothetical protein DVY43_01985 [Enterococcus faecalis]TKO76935.1 hypothetical protein DVY36_01980 [Enterococcus faecalis]TKP07168.1 hypothetical protein DVY35_01985 [Enterococcus faecalis]